MDIRGYRPRNQIKPLALLLVLALTGPISGCGGGGSGGGGSESTPESHTVISGHA